MNHEQWLKKLAWFVMTYMNSEKKFYIAVGEYFSSDEIVEFDKLTDELFPEAELAALREKEDKRIKAGLEELVRIGAIKLEPEGN